MNEARIKAQAQVQAAKADIEKDREAAQAGLQAEVQALADRNHAARTGAGRSRTLMSKVTMRKT